MAIVCSCDVIDTQAIQTYLRLNGPTHTEKAASRARASLHKEARIQREAGGLDKKTLCASCVLRLLQEIMKESRAMYPDAHKQAA